jgi:hypothetical protein
VLDGGALANTRCHAELWLRSASAATANVSGRSASRALEWKIQAPERLLSEQGAVKMVRNDGRHC